MWRFFVLRADHDPKGSFHGSLVTYHATSLSLKNVLTMSGERKYNLENAARACARRLVV